MLFVYLLHVLSLIQIILLCDLVKPTKDEFLSNYKKWRIWDNKFPLELFLHIISIIFNGRNSNYTYFSFFLFIALVESLCKKELNFR